MAPALLLRTLALAPSGLALAALVACVDPRVPYVEPETTVVNFPPQILEQNLLPQPGTAPVLVLIGEECAGENTFSVGAVRDADLEPAAFLSWRWHFVRGDIETERADLDFSSAPNMTEELGAAVDIEPVVIDVAKLRTVTEDPSRLVGFTHRVELRVTDGRFLDDPSSIDVVPDTAEVAFAYWLIELEDRPCL